MTKITHKYYEAYKQQWLDDEIVLNKERIDLLHYLDNVVLTLPDIYFDEKQIDDFVAFTEKWFFPLEPFQKFLVAFVFLYQRVEGYEDEPVFDQFFWTMARGAGKNGLISALSAFLISSLHPVDEYHIAIVANSEHQAKKSFIEVHNMLKRNDQLVYSADNPQGLFVNQKSVIECTQTYSTLEYMTSNAGTKDSFAHGAVIFDEIHQYVSDEIIDTLTSGLGKVLPPREFYISTNGFVREGVYDRMIQQARDILEHEEFRSRMFPWICTLDDKSEVEDEINWQKANPMFHEPLSQYARGLMSTVRRQWEELKIGNGDLAKWLIKRMNISDVELETSIATREEMLATNQSIPNLDNLTCIGGLDYASMRDFASVGCLFYVDNKFVWITHSFIRAEYLRNEALAISDEIPNWQERGLLTVVDEPTISMRYIVDWFETMRERYGLTTIVGDLYRMDLVKPALEDAGFELEFIRRSAGVQASIAPEIEVLFAERRLVFGDNPLMRWFTNNVFVKRDKFGNMSYEKKEERKRKTDGFMAFVHAFWRSEELREAEIHDFEFDSFWD